MIVLAIAAAEAGFAIPFAPPLDTKLRYRIVRTDPGAKGDSRIETVETLRFARDGPRYVATHELVDVSITAPPRLLPALQVLFLPLLHIPAEAVVSVTGIVGAPIDPDRPWAAVRVANAALDARIAADVTIPPAVATIVRRALSQDVTPSARDDRLTEPVVALLAPVLPPLRPGIPNSFDSTIAAAGAVAPARGTMTLVRRDPGSLSVRITLVSVADAMAAAADRLRATISPTMPPELRDRIELGATELGQSVFAEESDYAIDARTGLILSRRIERSVTPLGGPRRSLGVITTERVP